ncbi:sortase [Candidatus Saccharibacteria bacterium]|nr:sortase [Candidatus Saccharibacteria bacterium]
MGKRLFLLIICSLLVLIDVPEFLIATDVAPVTGLSNSGIVETVPLPEPEPEPEPVAATANVRPATQPSTHVAPAPVKPSAQVAPANSIAIAGKVIEIVDVSDTAVNAGNHVNKYGAKFLYGHNSPAVFGRLTSVGVGSVFTVAYGGTSRNYQVAEVTIFEKTSDTTLSAGGIQYRMSTIANGKGRYDMVLMTCYGTMLGGGDATHRYVVFANAI